MIFKNYIPVPSLLPFVKRIELRHFKFGKEENLPFKAFPPVPYHSIELFTKGFEIAEEVDTGRKIKKARSVLSGQYTHRINRHISQEFLMIVIVFHPGVLYQITGIPFSEFNNRHIDLELIYPSMFRDLNEQLCNTDSYLSLIHLVEDFLQKFIAGSKHISLKPLVPVFETISEKSGRDRLDWLACQAYLSPRQFERVSLQYVGTCPRTYSRIARFHQSWQLKMKRPHLDWSWIAASCGYADYQHMVKDYKAFALATPKELMSLESHAPGRLLGLRK